MKKIAIAAAVSDGLAPAGPLRPKSSGPTCKVGTSMIVNPAAFYGERRRGCRWRTVPGPCHRSARLRLKRRADTRESNHPAGPV